MVNRPRTPYGEEMLFLLLACRAHEKPSEIPDSGDTAPLPADDLDADGYPTDEDCDDAQADVHPDATETCDERDEDCDGDIDEGTRIACYPDADGDGYGAPGEAIEACACEAGTSRSDADCDDADPAVFPSAAETCDERDNDCDGSVDEGLDADGDGYTVCVGDCDDAAPAVNPGAVEVCGDGLDNDCSGDAAGCGWGGSSTTDDATMTLTGDAINAYLGSALSLAGDVDGDGRDDLLVGARHAGSWTSPPGTLYVFHGPIGAETLDTADHTIVGDVTAGGFGGAVAIVGDTDLDGKDDVLVGASRRPDGWSTYVGAAYFFRGDLSDTTADTADATVTCSDELAQCGMDVAAAGDVDGDGVPDALVSSSGRVGVFLGATFVGTVPLADADVAVTSDEPSTAFGTAIDGLGDIDGDGLGDWVATAHLGAEGYGAAYVFLGGGPSDLGSSEADAIIVGENAESHFGCDVAALGDTNGDGLGDFVVGAYDNRDGGMQAGAVYVFLGLPTASSAAQADADLTGAPYDSAGMGMSRVGDADGDGRDDMLVSAMSEGGYGAHRGAVYLFRGPIPSGALTTSDAAWTGVGEYDIFGTTVSSGDADGDGSPELVVGSPQYATDDMGGAGAVWYFPDAD